MFDNAIAFDQQLYYNKCTYSKPLAHCFVYAKEVCEYEKCKSKNRLRNGQIYLEHSRQIGTLAREVGGDVKCFYSNDGFLLFWRKKAFSTKATAAHQSCWWHQCRGYPFLRGILCFFEPCGSWTPPFLYEII